MITLKNQKLTLTIDPLGAQWTSLQTNKSQREHLFQKNPDSWMRQAPLLFPIVGRLLENRYEYNDQIYELSQHGFLRDQMFEVMFHHERLVILQASYDSHTLERYPFKFKVMVTYQLLNNSVRTVLEVFNLDEQTMYFNIGGHPAFIIDPNQDNILTIKGKDLGQFILKGPYVSDHQPLKSQSINLKELNLPETFIVNQAKEAKLQTMDQTITLKMKPKSIIGFWSPLNQKTNSTEALIAMEPWWGIADCENHNLQLTEKKGIIKLKPKRSKVFEFTFKIKSKL